MIINLGKILTTSLFIILSLAISTKLSDASVLSPPWCYVSAEVVDSNEDHLYWQVQEIIKVEEYYTCPVNVKEVYKSFNGYPDLFSKSDKIFFGVSGLSTMGPNGSSLSSLVWSDIKDEDGNSYDIFNGMISSEADPYLGFLGKGDTTGITFQDDCFIGASNSLEIWACKSDNLWIVTFSRFGVFSTFALGIASIVVIVFAAIPIIVFLFKRNK